MDKKRLRILKELNVAEARKLVPFAADGRPMGYEGLLAGMHKARMIADGITDDERALSRKWLTAMGMTVPGGAN